MFEVPCYHLHEQYGMVSLLQEETTKVDFFTSVTRQEMYDQIYCWPSTHSRSIQLIAPNCVILLIANSMRITI